VDESERLARRQAFDTAADRYDRYRPDYPAALYTDLIEAAGLRPGERLLEVGCGTGKATRPLADRNFALTCVEIGTALASAARRSLAGRDVRVIEASFDDWEPDDVYALVFAATAWHWPDPVTKYLRAWRALRPDGHLAFWAATHVVPEDADPFFADIQDVYREISDGDWSPPQWSRPGELPESGAEITATRLFDVVLIRHYDWEIVYTAQEYTGLLSTFSDHINMRPAQRDRLFSEIRRRLAARPDSPGCPSGSVRYRCGSVLHVARRRSG
jgi:SAM-dependent methyltransferase